MNEDYIKKIAEQVFNEKLEATQYSFKSIPFHTHNQTDSPRIPPTSVLNFATLPANNGTVTSGVLSTNSISVSEPPYGVIYPTPVIRGVGVGVYSTFNGGDAPLGSTVAFMTPGLGVWELWVMLEDASGVPHWYGTSLTAL